MVFLLFAHCEIVQIRFMDLNMENTKSLLNFGCSSSLKFCVIKFSIALLEHANQFSHVTHHPTIWISLLKRCSLPLACDKCCTSDEAFILFV